MCRQGKASLVKMLEQELFDEKRLDIYKRGHVRMSHTKAKNTDVITAKCQRASRSSHGLALHMTEDIARLETLIGVLTS